MAALAGAWAPIALRSLRFAATHASKTIRNKLSSGPVTLQTRNLSTGRQPIHPTAFLRQKRAGRWSAKKAYQQLQQTARRWISSGGSSGTPRFDRTKFPLSNTWRQIAAGPGRAPFASTLRPNLTGGALPRTQGGYGLGGGGARYFSHTPAAPAQVVQNVGVAMRAFLLSGQKARFDGLNERGNRRYKTVSPLEHDAYVKMTSISRFAAGSFVDFTLSPTITALSPLAAAFPFPSGAVAQKDNGGATLNQDGFLDVLSEDFGRALQDLTAIFADLKRLAVLGDLPISLENGNTVRVRFPGVDAETVERLCDDIGVQRGVVHQDTDFEENGGVSLALKFPFAPDSDVAAKTVTSPGGSLRSESGYGDSYEEAFEGLSAASGEIVDNPWLSDPEGYESMSPPPFSSGTHCSQDFEGLEGIYRFLEECDRAKARF